MLIIFLDVDHMVTHFWGLSINGLTLWSTKLPLGPDTI